MSLPIETIEAIKEYRNRVGCSLREARDAVLAGMQTPQSEIESLRSALSAAREEAKDADRVRALLGEILDALCGVLKPNTPTGVLPSYADLPDLARAAREEARAAEQKRDEWKGMFERLTDRHNAVMAEKDAAEQWQREVAEGLGYLNRPEGQGGYEVAEPRVIIEAFRAADAEARRLKTERDAFMASYCAVDDALLGKPLREIDPTAERVERLRKRAEASESSERRLREALEDIACDLCATEAVRYDSQKCTDFCADPAGWCEVCRARAALGSSPVGGDAATDVHNDASREE